MTAPTAITPIQQAEMLLTDAISELRRFPLKNVSRVIEKLHDAWGIIAAEKREFAALQEQSASFERDYAAAVRRADEAEARCCFVDCAHEAACRTCEERELAE